MTEFITEIKEIKTWLLYSETWAVSYQFLIMDWWNPEGFHYQSRAIYKSREEAEEASREFYWSM